MPIKKFLRRLFHVVLGLLLLPCVWAAFLVLARMVYKLGVTEWKFVWIYAAGALSYLIMERVFHRPMWIYIVGHELTHALSGLLTGARIRSFKASDHQGEVQLSKTNWFIVISPYIIPLYALLLLLIYAVLWHYWPHPALTYGFQFLMGAALTFHLSLTFMAFHARQSDLKVLGFFLSLVLILLGNALILGVLCVSLFGVTPPIEIYFSSLLKETVGAWTWIVKSLPLYFQKLETLFRSWTR
ncbi:MAG: hypothetical protein LHV69_07470 [Elusimicrobia bacterium]|nr:hypothetical protein [Candidatus Obscuribacterium magneticum]